LKKTSDFAGKSNTRNCSLLQIYRFIAKLVSSKEKAYLCDEISRK